MRTLIFTKTAADATVIAIIAAAVAFGTQPNAEAQSSRPAAPAGFGVSTGSGQGELDVIWTAHPDDVKDYRVTWAPTGESFKKWNVSGWSAFPTGTSHTITGLDDGTEYKVRVRARFETGKASHWTTSVTAATNPAPAPPVFVPPPVLVPPTEPEIARHHSTDSVTVTYHGDADKRTTNLTVVRWDHKDVHFTWDKPTDSDGDDLDGHQYILYRQWKGADADGVLCLHRGMSTRHTTSYTDTSVASYHPGGDEAKYEYRLYTRESDHSSMTGTCDRTGWPSGGGNYVKIVVPVNHHEDVYAATNTGVVQHNDPQVPTFSSVTADGRSGGVIGGSYIVARWNAIPYAPGYRVQYKKTSEADTEWKATYQFRILEANQDVSPQWDNCTGDPNFSDNSTGERAEERGTGTRVPSSTSDTCKRTNYPTDQVGHRWPAYWGADGHSTRHAPTKVVLQRLEGNTQYDIRIAMCTELVASSTRGLPVCADVGDYSAKRTIRTAP